MANIKRNIDISGMAGGVSMPKAPVSLAWDLASLQGRLVELSGSGSSAQLTAAFGLVLDAQRRHEWVAWVTLRQSSFFAPDAAEGGVDLDALIVVRVADAGQAGRAADELLRANTFGAIVIDLGGPARGPAKAGHYVLRQGSVFPPPLLTRLVGLAQKHDTAVVFLTDKTDDTPSISSLISLRANAHSDGCHVRLTVLKDKRRGPGATYVEVCRGSAGVC
jgi:recombination protein RecA